MGEQGDSTGEMNTEQDENDAPKDNVALSVDERMKAFENDENEEKEEAVIKNEQKTVHASLSTEERMEKAFEQEEKEKTEGDQNYVAVSENKDIRKVNQGMKAFDHKADR